MAEARQKALERHKAQAQAAGQAAEDADDQPHRDHADPFGGADDDDDAVKAAVNAAVKAPAGPLPPAAPPAPQAPQNADAGISHRNAQNTLPLSLGPRQTLRSDKKSFATASSTSGLFSHRFSASILKTGQDRRGISERNVPLVRTLPWTRARALHTPHTHTHTSWFSSAALAP